MRAFTALLFLCVFALVGCGTSTPQRVDGQWAAEGFLAQVENGHIAIVMVSDTDTALYWDGSAPTGEVDGEFTSVANKAELTRSILGSTADSKTFTVEDDTLSFEITVMNSTKTIELSRS